MLVDIWAEYRYSFGLQNSKKMARVPPCVSYMLVTQKSGRVQILVLTATLKQKNGQGTALCFIYLFG